MLTRISELMAKVMKSAITCSAQDMEWQFTIPDMSQEFDEQIKIDY